MELYKDPDELSRAAAEKVIAINRKAASRGGRFSLVLSGGSTPRRLFQMLAAEPYCDQMDWTHVEFFWGDERTVPPDHQDSNFHMANEALLQKITLRPEQIHRMKAESEDPDASARDYQREIAKVFEIPERGRPPSFDLVLLGLGPDAHTASLFPHTSGIMERESWVVKNHVPQLKTNRITMTVPILNRAKMILFLVVGHDKAEALHSVIEGSRDPERFPAQLIQPDEGELVWMVDREAAARIDSKRLNLSQKN
ncbi:MAG: 6-phosphogluconolactonase [Deltaproteobacteria bacterium]|nr:6-phosphogluconolactonase [Deltaproteobacteria bacterium]